MLRLLLVAVLLGPVGVLEANAAGRTYKTERHEDRIEYETCRFKRLSRTEDGNFCIYRRQSGGTDVSMGIDDGVYCQPQFRCKKE